MPIDAGIYQNLLRPPKTVQEFDNEAMQAKGNALGLQQQSLQLNALQRQQADDLAYKEAARGFGSDAQGNANLLFQKGLPTQAMAIQKAGLDANKTKAETSKDNATAAKTDFETQVARKNQHLQQLVTVQDVPGAVGWITDAVKSGELPMQQAQQVIQSLQSGQLPLSQWRQRAMMGGLSSQEQLNMMAPKFEKIDNGGQISFTDLNGYSPTFGGSAPGGPIKKVATPGEVLQSNTSRANNSANIAKDFAVAGIAPGGGLSPDMETTAKAIANGQLPAPTGMALLNPRNQRVLARVMEINPQYDATTVTAKKKAASDFTTGNLGNSMRSFAVAGQHLDQLGQLVDALDNGNMQVVNKIGNYIATQTGNPAPTNFDAAKDVVGKEVVKAIVAGGGGVSERQELSNLMSQAKSPAQLKGVIAQYRNLMAAQHDALLQQRRAAGLPDSTMPNYTQPDASPSSSVPPEIAAILKKHGGK